MSQRTRPPIHPGITLHEDVMVELGFDAQRVARILGIPAQEVSEIVEGKRPISADIALRLAEWLGTSAEFWMRLQEKYDLELTRMNSGDAIRVQVTERLTPALAVRGE